MAARWDRVDWLVAISFGLLAAAVRGIGLGTPRSLVFDEFYYVPDACRYAIGAPDLCGTQEFTWMQPPLGKWLIGFGMQILGPTRYGWRLAPLLAGAATVALVYLAGRLLLQQRVSAVIAAGLITIDPMHYLFSRLAILDIFVALFAAVALVCALLDRARAQDGPTAWRWAAGAACGAAVASKWSGALLAVGLAVIVHLWDRRRGWPATRSLISLAIAFALVPVAIYAVSYAGRFDGALVALPWSEGSWIGDFLHRQARMWRYHTTVRSNLPLLPHPSASPAWSWLLVKRPMALFFDAHSGVYREVLAMGHPLLWPLAIPTFAWLGIRAVRERDPALPATALVVLLAALYLPWFVLTLGGQDPYPYYLLPALPALYLGLGAAAGRLWHHRRSRIVAVALAVLAAGIFVFYVPVLSARPLSVADWRKRILFHDCAEFEGPALDDLQSYVDPDLPLQGLDRPPRPSDRLLPTGTKATGWCWI